MKSTVPQIRQRFDNDVDRFSNLDTGQSAIVDAPLTMNLIAQTAVATNPQATAMLDVGCGAGNYTLKILTALPGLDVTLVDLSQPMLDRAVARAKQMDVGDITPYQSDIRDLDLGEEEFDIITAAAVLHHLRSDAEWKAVFAKFYAALKPGGSIWISDLVEHSMEAVQAVMWTRYGEYLTEFKDDAYREQVFGYIEQEDTPRSLLFQIDMLRNVGFETVEILHKNSCFAAFGAIKSKE